MTVLHTWFTHTPTERGYYWIDHDMLGERIVVKVGDLSEEQGLDLSECGVYIQDGDEYEYIASLEDVINENVQFNMRWRFIERLEDTPQ